MLVDTRFKLVFDGSTYEKSQYHYYYLWILPLSIITSVCFLPLIATVSSMPVSTMLVERNN